MDLQYSIQTGSNGRESIEEHRETRDSNHSRDFIDVYLAEMDKGGHTNYDQEGLELTCLDLFKVLTLH